MNVKQLLTCYYTRSFLNVKILHAQETIRKQYEQQKYPDNILQEPRHMSELFKDNDYLVKSNYENYGVLDQLSERIKKNLSFSGDVD